MQAGYLLNPTSPHPTPPKVAFLMRLPHLIVLPFSLKQQCWASSRCLQCPGAPRGEAGPSMAKEPSPEPVKHGTAKGQFPVVPVSAMNPAPGATRCQLQEQLSKKRLSLHSSAPSWKRARGVLSQRATGRRWISSWNGSRQKSDKLENKLPELIYFLRN